MQGFIRVLIIACITMTATSQATHMDEDTIDKRTSPVGKVHIEGMEKATEAEHQTEVSAEPTQPTVEAVAEQAEAEVTTNTAARSGESIYNSLCIACHSVGLANAPKTGDSAAWSKLLEGGMDALVASAKKGKNVMPPMGTCADCSDDELKSAIEFMTETK